MDKKSIDIFYDHLGSDTFLFYSTSLIDCKLSQDEKEKLRYKMYDEFFNVLKKNGLNKSDFYRVYKVLVSTDNPDKKIIYDLFDYFLKHIYSVFFQYEQIYLIELMGDILFHYVLTDLINEIELNDYKNKLIETYNTVRLNENHMEEHGDFYIFLKKKQKENNHTISEYFEKRIDIGIDKINRITFENFK